MQTQTMTPKAVHPTEDRTSECTVDKVTGFKSYASNRDGFVMICNDDYAHASISDPAQLAQLKLWNAELIISSPAYVRVSQLKRQAVDKLIENVDHSQVIDYL